MTRHEQEKCLHLPIPLFPYLDVHMSGFLFALFCLFYLFIFFFSFSLPLINVFDELIKYFLSKKIARYLYELLLMLSFGNKISTLYAS
jgi:Fe2+ transport system protein B